MVSVMYKVPEGFFYKVLIFIFSEEKLNFYFRRNRNLYKTALKISSINLKHECWYIFIIM